MSNARRLFISLLITSILIVMGVEQWTTLIKVISVCFFLCIIITLALYQIINERY